MGPTTAVSKKRVHLPSLTKACAIFFGFSTVLLWICSTAGAEKSVTEEIVDILKENDQISHDQYAEMTQRAANEKSGDWNVFWKNGTHIESRDEKHKIKFGGRIALDWAFIEATEPMNAQLETAEANTLQGHGVSFRQARVFVQGTVNESIDFKLQYDFSGPDPALKDAFIGLSKVPALGHIRVGHMKEPMSIEEITSGKYITFMESALPVLAFAPSRNTGIMAFRNAFNKRLYWGAGVFYDVDSQGDQFQDNGEINATGRITGLPFYAEGGRKLLHIGLGYTHQFRDEDQDTLRFRSRPESHITDVRTIDTGRFYCDGADIFNPEAALVWGPFSLQSEYFYTTVNSKSAGDPTFTGAYLFGSWLVTGENRNFNPASASFDRVSPKSNFSFSNAGWGALELALRWSYLDLSDESIAGGKENNVTAGMNWYLTPNARLMVNYVHGAVKNRTGVANGDLNILESRFQIDF